MLNRRGGIECDFTVTRLATDRFLIVTGTAFGNHDLGWIRKHLARAPRSGSGAPVARVRVRDVTSARACFGVWGPKARDILQPLTKDDLSNDAFPYLTAQRDHARRRAGAGAAGHVRRRARLGAVLPVGVRARALGGRSGRRAGRTASSPAATARSTRCGSRRATASGRATSRPRRRRTRPGSGSRSSWTRAPSSSGATRSRRRAPPVRASGCAASSSTTRARSALGNEPVRVGGAIVGRVTRGGYGFAVERSIAYAYLPPDQAAIGTRGEVEVFGEWIGFEIAREPLWDPEGARIRA